MEKNSQISAATTGPVAQLGLQQNVASLITTCQFGGETASSYISLPQAHTQASTGTSTESCLSRWSLFLQNPPTLCSSYPGFSMFMHSLCSYLQECIHRAILSIALHLNHSPMPQQTKGKHCHVTKATPQTHLLQLQMRKAGRWKTLVNQPKADYPLLLLSLKVCFFFSCIVAAIFRFCPNETNRTMLQALLIP